MLAQQYGTMLFGLACAVVGAFITALMGRMAILPTLRRHTETEESIRQMIAQRSIVMAELYAKLVDALNEYADFLSPTKGVDASAQKMMDAARTFTDYYRQVAAIWLPTSVDEKVEWLTAALHNVYKHTVVARPTLSEGVDSYAKSEHFKQRDKALERIKNNGDINAKVLELRSVLRQVLEGRKIK